MLINLLKDRQLSGCTWMYVDGMAIRGCRWLQNSQPPDSQLTPTVISLFQHPCFYSGDFNCWDTDWGYDSISSDRKCLANWSAQDNLVLLHNPKDALSFFSDCWHTGNNPDVAFESVGHESWSLDRLFLRNILGDNTDLC